MVSAAKTRLSLEEAAPLAVEVAGLLESACQRVAIAGSIRRRRPTIGDLEIVAVPRFQPERIDLFGTAIGVVDQLDTVATELIRKGVFGLRPDKNGRTAAGDRFKRLTYRGFGLDLFATTADQFGLILLIRTGSAEFSHRFVSERRMGGCMPFGFRVKDGHLWDGDRIVPTLDEQSVFRAVGLPWLDPIHRTDTVRPSFSGAGPCWSDQGRVVVRYEDAGGRQ